MYVITENFGNEYIGTPNNRAFTAPYRVHTYLIGSDLPYRFASYGSQFRLPLPFKCNRAIVNLGL